MKWYGLTSSVTGNGTGVNTGNYGLSVDFNGNALSGGQIYTASGQVTGAGTGTGFTAAENALVNGKSYNIAGAPLHFVRSGFIDINRGTLWRFGESLYAQTGTNYDPKASYYLYIHELHLVVTSEYSNHWRAYSIRCLAY